MTWKYQKRQYWNPDGTSTVSSWQTSDLNDVYYRNIFKEWVYKKNTSVVLINESDLPQPIQMALLITGELDED